MQQMQTNKGNHQKRQSAWHEQSDKIRWCFPPATAITPHAVAFAYGCTKKHHPGYLLAYHQALPSGDISSNSESSSLDMLNFDAKFLTSNRTSVLISTPWKITMEPTNHPFRKEDDLNQTSMRTCSSR